MIVYQQLFLKNNTKYAYGYIWILCVLLIMTNVRSLGLIYLLDLDFKVNP